MGPQPWTRDTRLAKVGLPRAPGCHFSLFAGTAGTTWTVSQVRGVAGHPTFHQADLALRCGWVGGWHLAQEGQQSWTHLGCDAGLLIKGSPPGTPAASPATSAGCPVHPLVAAALGPKAQGLSPVPGLVWGPLSAPVHPGYESGHQGHQRYRALAILPPRPLSSAQGPRLPTGCLPALVWLLE